MKQIVKKKQTTRLLKCECPKCGYVARVTKKWLQNIGAPHCGNANHSRMVCDEYDEWED